MSTSCTLRPHTIKVTIHYISTTFKSLVMESTSCPALQNGIIDMSDYFNVNHLKWHRNEVHSKINTFSFSSELRSDPETVHDHTVYENTQRLYQFHSLTANSFPFCILFTKESKVSSSGICVVCCDAFE